MGIFAVDEAGFASQWTDSARGKTFLVGLHVDSEFRVRLFTLREIAVDGMDATRTIVEMTCQLRNPCTIVLLPSACVAGFNVVDIAEIHTTTGTPTAVVNTQKPRARAVRSALRTHFSDWPARWEILGKMGEAEEILLRDGKKLYCHVEGMRFQEFRRLIGGLIRFGDIPEPLRIAKLVANAFSLGSTVRG